MNTGAIPLSTGHPYIAHEMVERKKSSLTLTYRKRKSESGTFETEVTGFDVKAYGDTPEEIEAQVEKLEKIGKKRMD